MGNIDMNECGSVVSYLTGISYSLIGNPDQIKNWFENDRNYSHETSKEFCSGQKILVRNDSGKIVQRLDPVKIFYEMYEMAKAICIADPKGDTIGIRPTALKKYRLGKFRLEKSLAVHNILCAGNERFETFRELKSLARKVRSFTPRQKRIFAHATGIAMLRMPKVNLDAWSGMKPYWTTEWQGLKLKPISESYLSGACFAGVEIEQQGKLVFKAHVRFNQIGPKSFGGKVEKDLSGNWDKWFDCQ